MKMPALVLVVALALLMAALWESLCHARNVRKVPVRILVNGTRGKTSVTRLITAALQGGGIRTRGKCTGTDPREIHPDGTETETLRPHGGRITELKGFFRRAAQDGAQAVVVECMAVRPEMQRTLARLLVKPTITLITNTLVDHVEEIGATEEETAEGLRHSLIKGTTLITDSPHYADWPHLIPSDREPLPEDYAERFSFPVYESNLRLSLAAAKLCGVPRDTALNSMPNARPDAGMAGPFRLGNSLVFNTFAANDPHSTALAADRVRKSEEAKKGLVILYNNRRDREYRLSSFIPMLTNLADLSPTLYAIGDNAPKVSRFFARRLPYVCEPLATERLLSPDFYKKTQAIFTIGNIKGAGYQMIRYCLQNEEKV